MCVLINFFFNLQEILITCLVTFFSSWLSAFRYFPFQFSLVSRYGLDPGLCRILPSATVLHFESFYCPSLPVVTCLWFFRKDRENFACCHMPATYWLKSDEMRFPGVFGWFCRLLIRWSSAVLVNSSKLLVSQFSLSQILSCMCFQQFWSNLAVQTKNLCGIERILSCWILRILSVNCDTHFHIELFNNNWFALRIFDLFFCEMNVKTCKESGKFWCSNLSKLPITNGKRKCYWDISCLPGWALTTPESFPKRRRDAWKKLQVLASTFDSRVFE